MQECGERDGEEEEEHEEEEDHQEERWKEEDHKEEENNQEESSQKENNWQKEEVRSQDKVRKAMQELRLRQIQVLRCAQKIILHNIGALQREPPNFRFDVFSR